MYMFLCTTCTVHDVHTCIHVLRYYTCPDVLHVIYTNMYIYIHVYSIYMYIHCTCITTAYHLYLLRMEWNWDHSSWERFQDVDGGVVHGNHDEVVETLPEPCENNSTLHSDTLHMHIHCIQITVFVVI